MQVDLSIILEHIESLCGYNKELYDGYIAYLAHIIQRPYELSHSSFIFISPEGTGKDKHYIFLSKVIGEKYCVITGSLESVLGKFNSLLAGKLLITINETDPKESKEREASIKHFTTAETVTIEGKYKDPIKANNYARFTWYSNKTFAYPVTGNSRRPRICKSSDKYISLPSAEKKAYFEKLIAQMNDKNVQYSFLRYLQSYDISTFDFQKVIKSDLHVELEKFSAPVLANFLLTKVNAQKEAEQKYRTMAFYRDYHVWLRVNNFKYETDTKKLKFELTNTYNIPAKNITGYPYYIFVKADILKLLKDKFKIVPDDITNDDEDDEDDGMPSHHKSVPIPQADYVAKSEFQKLEEVNEVLRKEIEQLKKQNDKKVITVKEEIQSIKDLEILQHLFDITKQRTFKTCKKGLEIIKYLDWEFNGKFAKCISDDDAIFQEDEINLIF